MTAFAEIEKRAAGRKGGQAAMEALLPEVPPASKLARLGDDRLLAIFSRGIFQTGLNWKVVENKWPGIEEAFEGFDPNRNAMMSDETFDALLGDARIIRHGAKIQAVRDNAAWFVELARAHGSACEFFAAWPPSDQVSLLDLMKKKGARLGGSTGMYGLRFAGKDCFVLSKDVSAALVREGVVDKPPSSKTALARVQQAFNAWHDETGRPYTHLSRILAMSVG